MKKIIKLRSDIYLRDNGICWICNSFVSLDDYDLGHLVDRTNGGHDDYDNLAVMHRKCNHSKPYHNTLEEALRWKLTYNIPESRPIFKSQPILIGRPPKKQLKRANQSLSRKALKNQQERLEEIKLKIKPGTLCWIQGRPHGGAMWKILPPPYTKQDLISTRLKPPGATDNGLNRSEETIQIIGGGQLTQDVIINNGVVDVLISCEGGRLILTNLPSKRSNNKGVSVGMGKDQIPVKEWLYFKKLGMPFNEFIQTYNP